MPKALPVFRYHPDPLSTGAIEASEAECVACERSRGFIYVGPVYAEDEYEEAFCPWCIANGSAAETFDVEFTDAGWGVPGDVPASVCDEIIHKTPGFESWQQGHWLYHCGDGCAFLGAVGRVDLDAHPEALEMLMHEHDEDGWTPAQSSEYVDGLDADGDATAYLFRCLVCGAHVAFSDYS